MELSYWKHDSEYIWNFDSACNFVEQSMAKVVFLLRSVFFLLLPLLLNILFPRGTEILGKHLSKWGIICKSPIWEQWVGGWDCNICSSWSIPSGHDPLCQKTNVQGKSKAKYKSIPDNRASGSDWKLLYQLQSTFVSNDWNPRWPTFACIFSPPEPSSSTLAANFNSKRNLPVIL